jgi:hypothetical protein
LASASRSGQSAAFALLPTADAAVYAADKITPRAKERVAALEQMAKGDPELEARIKAFKTALGI